VLLKLADEQPAAFTTYEVWKKKPEINRKKETAEIILISLD